MYLGNTRQAPKLCIFGKTQRTATDIVEYPEVKIDVGSLEAEFSIYDSVLR